MTNPGLRRSLLASFINNYYALSLNIVTTVVLARLLSPGETGLFSVAAGLINVLQALREFGTGVYIVQEPDLTRQKLGNAVALSLGIGFGLMLGFIAGAPLIAAMFRAPRLELILRLMSLNFPLVAMTAIGSAQMQRAMRFDRIMRISITQNSVQAGLSIILAAYGFGALAIAWATLAGSITSFAGYLLLSGRQMLVRPTLRGAAAMVRFGALATPANLIGALSLRLPDIVVGRLLGFEMAGLFSRGNGLVTLFEQAVMAAIMPVASSALSQIRRGGGDVAGSYRQTLRQVIMVAWPALGMMAMLAMPIIRLAFGTAWLAAVPVAQILCLAGGFVVFNSVANALLNACGAVGRLLTIQAVASPLLLAALVIGCADGIEGAAWGVAACTALVAIIALVQSCRLLAVPITAMIGPLTDGMLALATTLALPLLFALWLPIDSDHWLLPGCVRGSLGAASGLVYLLVRRHPLANELVSLYRRTGR